jgi:hypothetical protein
MKTSTGKVTAGVITLISLCADIIALYSYFKVTSGLTEEMTIPLYLSFTDANQLAGTNFMSSRLVDVMTGIAGLFVLGIIGVYVSVGINIGRWFGFRSALKFVLRPLLVFAPLIILWGHLRWGWIPVRSVFLLLEGSIIWLILTITAFKHFVERFVETSTALIIIGLGIGVSFVYISVPFVVAYVFVGWTFLQSVVYWILICALGVWLIDVTD